MSYKATPSSQVGDWPDTVYVSQNKRGFNRDVARTMAGFGALIPICLETEVLLVGGALHQDPALQPLAENLIRNAASALGRPNATTCAELTDLCPLTDARMLRMVCGDTCGCTDPLSSAWFKVEPQGCGRHCLDLAEAKLQNSSCEDADVREAGWRAFWHGYEEGVVGFYGDDVRETASFPLIAETVEGFLTTGCSYMEAQPSEFITDTPWCDGHPELFRPLGSLCPVQCGCRDTPPAMLPNGLSSYCPTSCSSNSTSQKAG